MKKRAKIKPVKAWEIKKIARIIFDELTALEGMDGDQADWIFYREALESGARRILTLAPRRRKK